MILKYRAIKFLYVEQLTLYIKVYWNNNHVFDWMGINGQHNHSALKLYERCFIVRVSVHHCTAPKEHRHLTWWFSLCHTIYMRYHNRDCSINAIISKGLQISPHRDLERVVHCEIAPLKTSQLNRGHSALITYRFHTFFLLNQRSTITAKWLWWCL